ncbi:MAG: prephenate dehydrogenase [Lachnospiraceae bacterium]|nr:prephenate dehydrogenase [Lachnospiraceae bacterium]
MNNENNQKKTWKAGFLSLGLIGGSIAMTFRKKYPDAEIVALNRSPEPLQKALETNVINYGTNVIDDHFSNCDIIFLCGPIGVNIGFLKDIRRYISPSTILTDVGSVKSDIHRAVAADLPEAAFIGGHPMAGSEKSGYDNANDHLIENAYYILTPGPNVPQELIDRYYCLVQSLGALPLILSPSDHDYITAAISHVPHMIAYTLVRLVEESDSPEQYMKLIAAGGFKDITRIASSDPVMWEHICLSNPDNIDKLLESYLCKLQELRSLIKDGKGQELRQLFAQIRDYRNSIQDAPRGPIRKIYDLHCDIIDEAGAIATIATILSTQNVSIKNIGIVHNRTYEEGALHIEFYDEHAVTTAAGLLKKHGYRIYER